MKKFLYIFILLCLGQTARGQNLTDALRLSDYRLQGTARATAMGNAFGALGGDFTSASINPAGIGLYRSSEFEFSTAFSSNNTDGRYLVDGTARGNTVSESKDHLIIPNVGYVATFNTNSNIGSPLVSVNLGIGYNRMNDFNINKRVRGDNATTSMLDGFVENANNGIWDANYEELASQTDVLLLDTQDNVYWNDLANAGYGQSQRKSFTQKGSVDEYVFSLAFNFNHQLYIGATAGIQDVYFKENTSLYENDANNNIPGFNDYYFNTHMKTTGTGYNFKIGTIFKPVDQLRLGIAIHTPTYYDLHDSYYNSMASSITKDDGIHNYEAYSQYNSYDYDLRTPMKAIFSAAYVIGKAGLISVDYEYVDYANAKFSDGEDGYDFYNENDDIKEAFKSVGNLHVGGEYRASDNFSLRCGFEYYPSPYKSYSFDTDQPNGDADTYTYSGGIGWKMNGFFADLAYKHVEKKDYLYLYPVSSDETAPLGKFKYNQDHISLTLGFRF